MRGATPPLPWRASRLYPADVFARLVRTSPATLLYYRRLGLIAVRRCRHTRRESYDERALLRAQRIRVGRLHDWSLETIRTFLESDQTPPAGDSPPLEELFRRRLERSDPACSPARASEPLLHECSGILETLRTAHREHRHPSSERVQSAARHFHRHLERWFCPCPPQRFVELSALYIAQPTLLERAHPGASTLRPYLSAAVAAFCAAEHDTGFADSHGRRSHR